MTRAARQPAGPGYAHAMQVRIRLFAGLRERAGTGERTLDLTDGATLGDVWTALGLGEEPAGLLYAVNKRYAEPATALADGDEVALIPPVSGGDFRVTAEPLSIDAVVREVQRDEAGAVATFLGTVRNRSRDRNVLYLEYEAYEGMAEQTMAELARGADRASRAARHRDPPPRRPRRDRRAERRDRRLLPASSLRARGLHGGDRHAQGTGAALEEGGLRGRRGVDRAGLVTRAPGRSAQRSSVTTLVSCSLARTRRPPLP